MPAELEQDVLSLDGEEIKVGIAHKIATAIKESLDKQCHLYGTAYPKFKAYWTLHIVLDDFGRTVEINPSGVLPATEHDGNDFVTSEEDIPDDNAINLSGEIPETPPDQFRRETEQKIDKVRKAEKEREGAVVYQPKRKTR